MKKLVILLFIIALAASGNAQNAFRMVSSSFEESEQFFCSELSKKTIKLYAKQLNNDHAHSEALNGVDEIKVVSFNSANEEQVNSFVEKVKTSYELKYYTPFKMNSMGMANQLIYLKEKDDKFTDLLVINTNYVKSSLVEIRGDINLDKIAELKSVLNIEGIDALESIQPTKNKVKKGKKDDSKYYGVEDKFVVARKTGNLTVYNRWGNELIRTEDDPSLYINGYEPRVDFHSFLYEIDPSCIQSINVTKTLSGQENAQIDITLQGAVDDAFTVCNGMLYFGQNGYLQCIKIDDDCSPELLYDCKEKPLSSILQLEPNVIKSIELTTDPMNCEGLKEGEFVVVKLK